MAIFIGDPRLTLSRLKPYEKGLINQCGFIVQLSYLSTLTKGEVNCWRGDHPYIPLKKLNVTLDLKFNTKENLFSKLSDTIIPMVKKWIEEAEIEVTRGDPALVEQGQYDLYYPRITNTHLVPGLIVGEGTMINNRWFS